MTKRVTEQTFIELASVRARLAGTRGPAYWRSLEEVAETAGFKKWAAQEFPGEAAPWRDGLTRRGFLNLTAASLALAGLSACTKQPAEMIVPYVHQPEGLVLGQPQFYASSMLLGGFATGVLVKSREGHPIKVEGNPQHPASLGGSTVWMQAALADLYDLERSHAVTHRGELSSWGSFLAELNAALSAHAADRGAGLRVLTETSTSPTFQAQMQELLKKFPEARWHQYEPLQRDTVHDGALLAFGQVVEAQHRFERAAVVLSLDADFLYSHPMRLRYARDFSRGRQVGSGRNTMNRLYVLEPTPSVTGSKADHRLPLESTRIEAAGRFIAQQLGASVEPVGDPWGALPATWFKALMRDLKQHRGRSIVIAGEQQPPKVHALAHLLNEMLGNVGETVFYTPSAQANPINQIQSLRELVTEMEGGRVGTLLILGGNPAYTAPADLEFSKHLSRVPRSMHLAPCLDETSMRCSWHIPEAHFMESWGDARAFDGTLSMIQPLIAPLYGGREATEIIGALLYPELNASGYDIVRRFWENQRRWPDFEKGWRQALHDGFIAGSAFAPTTVRLRSENLSPTSTPEVKAKPAPDAFELLLRPDPNVWDGRFANNGWLQELPRPLHKISWDNAACFSPALAERWKLQTGDLVDLTVQGRTVRAPVWIMPGQAENSVSVTLGYGRMHAGRVGTGVGFDAYQLSASSPFWNIPGATLAKTTQRHPLVSTQLHHALPSAERQIYRGTTLNEYLANPEAVRATTEHPAPTETLYNAGEYKYPDYKWGMVIDLSTCIGCNACVLACQTENNIPVVGKEEMARGRDMHWIRVDTYFKGGLDAPGIVHMPVPCMHCEHAPCEVVCPVGATVHDEEGLNVQVYNRCVGTRYCSNNCPYKVRRFNFFQYANYTAANYKPMHNPEVTVRWRGVMEKCTYCVQRISAGRIEAKKANRRLHDGEVQTACQQACPAEAITFGDLNDSGSRVAQLKHSSLDYAVLGELNTRPRTTYLAQLENPEPGLGPSPQLR